MTEAMDLAKRLDELSKAATRGELIIPERDHVTDRTSAYVSKTEPSVFMACMGKPTSRREADTAFLVALWNAYRTGKLVVVPDDAVEQMVVEHGKLHHFVQALATSPRKPATWMQTREAASALLSSLSENPASNASEKRLAFEDAAKIAESWRDCDYSEECNIMADSIAREIRDAALKGSD